MKYIQLTLVFSILFLGCTSSKKSIQNTPKINYDIEFIDYLFKDYDGNRPSASVIVIKDNQIDFTKSYGYANLEKNKLATPKTNYRIASVTKQFTAMAIMILVNQDKLSYETKLTEIFPEFPKYGKDITIRQLNASFRFSKIQSFS